MAIAICASSIDEMIVSDINRMCRVKPRKSQYNADPALVDCFEVDIENETVYLPLGTWNHFLDEFPDCENHRDIDITCTKELYTIETDPKGYRDQDVVAVSAMEKLVETRTVFIACSPGWGKTSMGNYLSSQLGKAILVICHIQKVNKQWIDEFRNHSTRADGSPTIVHYLNTKKINYDADVFVCGVQKASKISREDFAAMGIGTVIFDEAHVATISAFSKSLLRVCPAYVIGMSATPERGDGLQSLLKMYFGPKKNYIARQETKDFQVYKYETDFEPTVDYQIIFGKSTLNWTLVINSLAYDKKRQATIADIVRLHPDQRVMVLSDRITECENVYNLLASSEGEDEVYLMDDSNKKDNIAIIQQYRILIAGRKRAGIGFDDPTRTMLVLCTDTRDVRQNEGRIRTVNNIVYDIVDRFSTLENHWDLREKWYTQRGATVEIIHRVNALDRKNKYNNFVYKRRM